MRTIKAAINIHQKRRLFQLLGEVRYLTSSFNAPLLPHWIGVFVGSPEDINIRWQDRVLKTLLGVLEKRS